MLPMASDRIRPAIVGLLLASAASGAQAQQPASPAAETGRRIIALETAVSDANAELTLELEGGAEMTFALSDGGVWLDGRRLGDYQSGGELDRSWRALLRDLRGSPESVAARLREWDAPAESDGGSALDEALEALGAGNDEVRVRRTLDPDAALGAAAGQMDSLDRLQDRIRELEATIETLEERSPRVEVVGSRGVRRGYFHNLWEGIAGVFSVLLTYFMLFAVAAAVVFFGGRPYLEGVSDTARKAPLRSGLVGFAASFLVVPAFIVGALVLAISIVGIPALLVWLPLFPLAVVLAVVLGYVAVAHAAGETLAERRFYGGEWFKRANSYYYLLTGLGLLVVLFIAANIMHMAGFLDFLEGLFIFLGVVLTWLAVTVGFGAVLISRGGTRPGGAPAPPSTAPFDEEPTHV